MRACTIIATVAAMAFAGQAQAQTKEGNEAAFEALTKIGQKVAADEKTARAAYAAIKAAMVGVNIANWPAEDQFAYAFQEELYKCWSDEAVASSTKFYGWMFAASICINFDDVATAQALMAAAAEVTAWNNAVRGMAAYVPIQAKMVSNKTGWAAATIDWDQIGVILFEEKGPTK